jgi:exonuclease III
MSFSIGSLNVNGMRGSRRRATIFDWVKNSKLDIIYLQECHCISESEINTWNREFGGKGFYSYGSNKSCGVGILFRPGFNFKITNTFKDTEGRLLVLDIRVGSQAFRLINIYANCGNSPARRQFIKNLDKFCTGSIFKIMGGDFNFIVDPSLDKVGGNLDIGTSGSSEMKQLCSDFSLVDVQRHFFPTKRFCTWSRGTVSCRLDRFYMSNSSLSFVEDTNVHGVPFSDHSVITLYLKPPDTPVTGPNFWKCNVSVLDDSEFVRDFESRWVHWSNVTEYSSTWWDWIKIQFKNLVIKHSRRRAKQRQEAIKILEEDLDFVLNMELLNPGNYTKLVADVKSQLNKLYSERMDGVKIRSRVQVLEESEKPSRYFLKREQCQAASSVIGKLNVDGREVTDIKDILAETSRFYQNLFQSEPVDQALLEYFLKDVPSLKEEEQTLCEGPITLTECEKAIGAMCDHKSPGLDGLPKEFYSKFFYLVGPKYVAMINRCFEEMVLPDSQRHGVIKLLCKDATHPELLTNWRPISLLNVDYKILTKVLTTRLSRVIGKIVHPDQTSSVPGRSILDNLHLIRNLIDYLEFKDLPGILVSLDQQKAFDRVNHHYLFSALKAYGFGPHFLQWIRIIYSDISSSVLVNGFLAPKFSLTRGVRQGCSLSPLLYILCLEPLLIKFRKDTFIKGVPVPGEQEEARVIAFADDVAVTVTDVPSVRKIFVLTECFESASGSKLNRNKSFGIWLGKWADRVDDSICSLKFIRDPQKFYGILLERGRFSEQNWTRILTKFKSTLNSYLHRDLGIRGRAVIANVMAASKLWYASAVLLLPSDLLHEFNVSLFHFVWANKPEWVSRKTMYAPYDAGGMRVVDIATKLHALRIMHLKNLIVGTPAKWKLFTQYFIGFHLKKYNANLYNRSRPHQIAYIPHFYRECLKSLDKLLKINSNPNWETLSTKNINNMFIDAETPELVVRRYFPAFNYQQIFNNVHNNFICSNLRELNWKIIHRILPVKFLLFARKISREKNCALCGTQTEMMDHLFLKCATVQDLRTFVNNFVNKMYNSRISFTTSQFLFLLDAPVKFKSTFIYVTTLCKYVIWMYRNRVSFEAYRLRPDDLVSAFRAGLVARVKADYFRFSYNKFRQFWPDTIVSVSNKHVSVKF